MNENEIVRYNGKIKEVVTIANKGGKYRYFGFVYIFSPFGAIVAVVWYGTIEHKWRNERTIISFVLYPHFVGASFGGIAELYAQSRKRLAQQKSFELLGETSEKINLIEILRQ
jgi:hypothetical protein